MDTSLFGAALEPSAPFSSAAALLSSARLGCGKLIWAQISKRAVWSALVVFLAPSLNNDLYFQELRLCVGRGLELLLLDLNCYFRLILLNGFQIDYRFFLVIFKSH